MTPKGSANSPRKSVLSTMNGWSLERVNCSLLFILKE